MKEFSSLGIAPRVTGFIGDKIKIDRILNREIVVHDFTVKDSTVKQNTKCLHMQIEINGNKHVVFSGSNSLIDQIQRVEKSDFPFKATVVKENERLVFT